MGQPVPELPADTLVSAVDNARRGVVTHITIKGECVLIDWRAVTEVRAGERST